MRLASHIFALSLGSSLLACSSTPATTTTITRPELVAVSPADFLRAQHCGDGPGLVGSYVATLFDVTTASDGGVTAESGFQLPSSPPTSCEFLVTFSYVLPGHRYRALVEGYDRLAQNGDGDPDATHIHAASPGIRLQQDGNGAGVAPRWTAFCGGYPATDPDAGLVADAGSVPAPGDGGDAAPPGALSYDTLTTTVHDCQDGLVPVQ